MHYFEQTGYLSKKIHVYMHGYGMKTFTMYQAGTFECSTIVKQFLESSGFYLEETHHQLRSCILEKKKHRAK